ncbi:MAG: hypothetical protein HKN21_17470, partial [Candidatus Eisenbacteria bacterium]|nr:hypothetical protein [Candidatus Eisenbacteria bacterium]
DQIHAPVVISLGFSEQLDVVLSSAGANSEITTQGLTRGMSGNADVVGQVLYRFPGDRFMVHAGVNAPAGKTGLSPEELSIAQALAHPLLGFTLKQYGRGLDLNGGIALAIPLSEAVNFGLGAGFLSAGDYTLLQDEAKYKPGAQISVSGGLDVVPTESNNIARFDVTYRLFGTDELGGNGIFEEGDQIEAQVLGQTRNESFVLSGSGRAVFKQDNTILTPGGDDVSNLSEKPGTSYDVKAAIEKPFSSTFALGLQGEGRFFRGSDVSGLDGSVVGGGPTMRIQWETGWFRLSGRYLTGSIDEGTETPMFDVSGFAISAALGLRGGGR